MVTNCKSLLLEPSEWGFEDLSPNIEVRHLNALSVLAETLNVTRAAESISAGAILDRITLRKRRDAAEYVKSGVKTDHWGGVKVDQWVGRRSGIVGEEGVWSGGLRRLKGGAFRPERKTSSSPRRVRRRG